MDSPPSRGVPTTRHAELAVALLLGAFSLYLMWLSGAPAWEGDPRFANIWYVPMEGPGSGFWPFWLSGVMLLCSVWIVVNWARRRTQPSRDTRPFIDGFGLRVVAAAAAGVAGFVALSSIVSMYAAMALFIAYYVGLVGRHSARLTAALALGLPVATFLLFDVAMRLPLPKGLRVVEDTVFVPLYGLFY